MGSEVYSATCSAPVNIAVIKYWGKRDTKLILPTNDSLSVTLDQDHLRSMTTARVDAAFQGGDRLWLNGVEEDIGAEGRLRTCIEECRKVRREMEGKDGSLAKVSEGGRAQRGRSCAPCADANGGPARFPRCPCTSAAKTTFQRQQALPRLPLDSPPSSPHFPPSTRSNRRCLPLT